MAFDDYFDRRSKRFAAFYGNEQIARLLGRGALFDRLRFAVKTAAGTGARHVLDVGCGSGPLFAPLASHGIRVTGLEPAQGMFELARTEASRFPGLVEVVQRPWESIEEEDEYDLAVALGVFDYVGPADDLLRRLRRAAPAVVASFPSVGLRTALRKLRYGARGVRVHGYEWRAIVELARGAGLEVAELRPLGRAGYAAHLSRRNSTGG